MTEQLKKEIIHLLANGIIQLSDIPCLKNDKEFVLEAVKSSGEALEYASKELQNDKEVVLEAIKSNGYDIALKYASEDLRGDKEVVMEAVKQCGEALEFASKELRGDKEVVLIALRLPWFSFPYLPVS